MGKPSKPAQAPPASPFNRPFSALAGKLGDVPPGPAGAAPPAASPPKPAASRAPPEAPARAVVRMERAGRGGKTVTVVEKLELAPAEREAWLSALKRALGCGGAVEGDALVLQGDVRERAADWLVKRGVRRVTR